MKKLSIVIPVYYNEGSLPALFVELDALEQKLAEKSLELELIFVDDGSGDNSLEHLLEFKGKRPATKIIKLTRNFGSIHSSKTGFSFVTGDAFTIMSADLQDPPSLVLEMADRWLKGSKFTICERISRSDPLLSKIYSWIYYRLLRLLVISDYPYGGFDMALIDKQLLPYILNSAKRVYTPLLEFWLGFKPEVIYYHRQARTSGKSKWTFKKKFSAFLDVMLGFSVFPIRAMTVFGFSVALISFLCGSVVVFNALLNQIPVPGYTTIVFFITFLLGTIHIMLGIIGEYLWRLFDEVNKRPETVIESIW